MSYYVQSKYLGRCKGCGSVQIVRVHDGEARSWSEGRACECGSDEWEILGYDQE